MVDFHEDPERLPPGHPERRQVSNAVLAVQIQGLQETVLAGQILAREQMKDGFMEVSRRLEKHDDLIATIRDQLVAIDARTGVLESARLIDEQSHREKERADVLELATARDGALNDRMTQFTAKLVVGSLGALMTLVLLIQAFGGFK